MGILTQTLIKHLIGALWKFWQHSLLGRTKICLSAIDLVYTYARATLDDETIELTGLSSGDKLFAFKRGFFGPEGFSNLLAQNMFLFFKDMIRQGSALVYIDDILLL